ncbi:MAG: hypothetical protein WAV10_04140 [Minisyncoccia bacterium]
MKINKKDVKKIKSATKEELGKLQEQYKTATKNVSGMSPIALLAISTVGIIIIFYFTNKLFILIGLILLLAPIYVFIKRGAHREGYFEGYYEMMKKLGSRDEHSETNKSE